MLLNFMDPRLRNLIDDYLTSVVTALALLADSGFEAPSSNVQWACNGMQHVGELRGGIKYFKHGYGCMVALPTGEVDFDFGDKGQVNGFDRWRLTSFAEQRLADYGFLNEDEVNMVFESAVRDGFIEYSGFILHYIVANRA